MTGQQKARVAIIGSGNIGTDILMKLRRSPVLEPVAMIGVDAASEGLARARSLGLWITAEGLEAFLAHPVSQNVLLVFDATSATAPCAMRHAELLAEAGKLSVDMTPAACGPYLVPPVNSGEHRTAREVNMVTCGGQATTPIVAAISQVQPVAYAEIVASIASKSAGPGTRQNIDEFTETTARAIKSVGGVRKGKAIIVLNPAQPPVMMRNTDHVLVDADRADEAAITASVQRTVQQVQAYVPGYHLTAPPLFEGRKVSVLIEVTGAGDYLPPYVEIGLHAHNNLGCAVANSLAAIEEGANCVDGTACGLGAGAGNTPTEVLVAALHKKGYHTGIDLYRLMDVAEEIVRPILPRPQIVDRDGLSLGYYGVYSSFLLHARRAAERFGVDTRDILAEVGRRKLVGGQEDLILDVAVELAQRTGRGADRQHETAERVAEIHPPHHHADGTHSHAPVGD